MATKAGIGTSSRTTVLIRTQELSFTCLRDQHCYQVIRAQPIATYFSKYLGHSVLSEVSRVSNVG